MVAEELRLGGFSQSGACTRLPRGTCVFSFAASGASSSRAAHIMPGAGDSPKLNACARATRNAAIPVVMGVRSTWRRGAGVRLLLSSGPRLVRRAVLLLIKGLGIERIRTRGNAGKKRQGDEN